MNLIEFTKIISDPSSISKGQTKGLDQILEEYPFFQSFPPSASRTTSTPRPSVSSLTTST